ncbi:hypothetical protein [Dulcicalothrix desertica]|nr:hypothetical protein [Dulcicalothrix desertica]
MGSAKPPPNLQSGDIVTLSSIDLEFAIEILYEGVVFEVEE